MNSLSGWGERRSTLDRLPHPSKLGHMRHSMLPVRPHTMATESDLNQRRVVPVLGAQFRSRASTPDPLVHSMAGSCPGCAALNSKLKREKTDAAELRRSEKEARVQAERSMERERELEEGWRSHQQKIGLEFERMRREAADALAREREVTEAAEAKVARLQARRRATSPRRGRRATSLVTTHCATHRRTLPPP